MHTTKRRFEPAVIERLFAEPQRFEYFQAVRMLELWLKRHGVPHEGAVANFLRFQNSTSLSFPASQVESLQPEPRGLARDANSLGEALRRAELKYIRITPAFMGMLGMTGSLPAHYTERIAAHVLFEKDEGPRAFLDTFSSRALALFYEAWRKYRLELKYQIGGKDLFLPLLLALAGVGQSSLQHRMIEDGGGLLDESLGYFCGAMLHRPTSAGTNDDFVRDGINHDRFNRLDPKGLTQSPGGPPRIIKVHFCVTSHVKCRREFGPATLAIDRLRKSRGAELLMLRPTALAIHAS
jgi:type VI secretion system protein ImpH